MKLAIRLSLLALIVPTLTWAEHPNGYEESGIEETPLQAPVKPAKKKFNHEMEGCGGFIPTAIYVDPQKSGTHLTKLESKAVEYYMAVGYQCINSNLRNGDSNSVQNLTATLDSALKKFPKYTKTVYRGESFSTEHMLPKQGQLIKDAGYLSTSTDPKIAAQFGAIQYEIHAFSCRDLSHVNRVEGEVICPRGTVFKVSSVKSDGNVRQYVLDEVSTSLTKGGT